jgi:hypothetical protein
VSTAAATVIAALSGLLGATIGGILAGRQQRSAQLRDRMLEVALEYVEALGEAMPGAPMEPRPASLEAKAAIAQARRMGPKVALLFGPESPAGERGIEAYFQTLAAFDHAEAELDVDERIEKGRAGAAHIWLGDQEVVGHRAQREVDLFATLAGRAIRAGGRHPWEDRGRRVRRSVLRSPKQRKAKRELVKFSEEYRRSSEDLKRSYTEARRALDEQAEERGSPE